MKLSGELLCEQESNLALRLRTLSCKCMGKGRREGAGEQVEGRGHHGLNSALFVLLGLENRLLGLVD